MNLKDYVVDASGTLFDCAQAISKNRSRCVVVCEQAKVIGVISEGDLLRAMLRGTDIHAPMREFIRHGFIYLEEKNFDQALTLCRMHGITLIPIVGRDMELKEIITLNEVLQRVRSVLDITFSQNNSAMLGTQMQSPPVLKDLLARVKTGEQKDSE